ncbi:YwpF-like family protein [Heyndrickxia sp. NPDC080065]|uniref:YwpF-like family protein n=1 Tax=Heyndrickxia sp. NPDC080065 TaxID=3390568 RepID=UPI003CFEA11E
MKTFKLVSLQVVDDTNIMDIPLEEGIIINKEDGKMTWLIEAYTDKKFYDYFRSAQQKPDDLEVQAVITNEANDPAPFKTHVRTIKSFDKFMSVLLEGHLNIKRSEYAELLLNDLIKEGFSGQNLVEEFKNRMRKKTRFAKAKK